ncbi:hypothetical protein CBR_g29574 [Chara braunii]|uniref:Uncharacterized protein n=1 Tax=Chara braunii TaxID=69332 RepID=A0A388LAT1_CHABU|nr:hypothetical protein CBR_g29574 [Chara braunii]|eukprot:GBG79427.1 hypothetical protein CBR_g29574 [Chara braunii]
MENSSPTSTHEQPPMAPFQQPPPNFPSGSYQQPMPAPIAPFGFAAVQQQLPPGVPYQCSTNGQPGQWLYLGQPLTSVPNNGQYQGYGHGNGGNYPPRAFFTREHAKFIDKLKMKEAIDEARRKDLEEITRLKGIGSEEGTSKESRSKGRKHNAKEKGKGKVVEDGKVDELKKWVAENFGEPLKILAEKLEVVEKKSKLSDCELEELKLLRAEKELRELRENSSNEKRKRDFTPFRPRIGKGESMKEVSVLKELIQELLAAKSKEASSCNSGEDGKKIEKKQGKVEHGGNATERGGEQEELGPDTARENGKDDIAPGLYFRDLVVYYDAMHYTKIQVLCKQKGIAYRKKEADVWELARLDFEVLQKLEKPGEDEKADSSGTSDEEEKNRIVAPNLRKKQTMMILQETEIS